MDLVARGTLRVLSVFGLLLVAHCAVDTPVYKRTPDPLVEFLAALTFNVDEYSITQGGVTFNAFNVVCRNLSVANVTSTVGHSAPRLSIGAVVYNLGISCTGNYSYEGLTAGMGSFTASVPSTTRSFAELTLAILVNSDNVPYRVQSDICNLNFNLAVKFSGSVLASVLQTFQPILSLAIKMLANQQFCREVGDYAKHNLTAGLRYLNKWLFPSLLHEGVSAFATNERPIVLSETSESTVPSHNVHILRRSGTSQTRPGRAGKAIDWQTVDWLRWTTWFMDELVGVEGVNELARWAANGTERLVLEGPREPIYTASLSPLNSGLALGVILLLPKIVINGWGNVENFTIPHAVSATDFAFSLDLGTNESPTVNLTFDFAARITANDTNASVDLPLEIKLGLRKPAINGKVMVACDGSLWQRTRTFAQLYFGSIDCLKSTLLGAPVFRELSFHFDGVSQPLEIEMMTTSDLENGLAKLLSNSVLLFNDVYEPHLPDAVERFLSSEAGLKEVNDALSADFASSECISAKAAKEKAQGLPSTFNDWPLLIENWARALVDNMVDGFFQKNHTDVSSAFLTMPEIQKEPFQSQDIDLPRYINIRVNNIAFSGVDRVDLLRLLITSSADPQSLGISLRVTCPSSTYDYSPSAAVGATLSTGTDYASADYDVSGTAAVRVPCGALEVHADVVVDVDRTMGLPMPPPPSCVLQPFATFNITSFVASWDGFPQLIVTPEGSDGVFPLAEFCLEFREACGFMSGLAANASVAKFNRYFDELRRSTRDQCDGDVVHRTTTAEPDSVEHVDFLGFAYAMPNMEFWASAVISTVLITTASSIFVFIQHKKGWRGANSLARVCLSNEAGLRRVAVVGVSLLLSIAAVTRIIADFMALSISVVTNLVSPALGGELVKVRLIALTFCGMIVEFWHAGAKFCGIVLSFIEVTMAGTIILIVALLWFTPFISNVHRRIIVRAVLLVGRYCSQGLETMSMTRRTLGPNVNVPLDVTTQIRVEIEVGAYMDIISHFFVIAVLLSFIALLPGGFKNAPPRAESGRDYMMLAQDVAAGSVVVGFVVWLAFPFFHVVTTEVAATLIKPRNVYAEELFLDAGAPLLSILVFLLVFVAPVLQVVSHVMERKQRPNRFLREFADALALVDVFLVALLVTFIWGIGKFVHHVVHYRFEGVCSALLETSGTDCLGLDVSLVASGSLGLFLAALGSFMLMCTHAIQDVLRLDVETQWPLEDDSSVHLRTEGTELSKDVMPVSHSLHS